jgi:hypothetical protein
VYNVVLSQVEKFHLKNKYSVMRKSASSSVNKFYTLYLAISNLVNCKTSKLNNVPISTSAYMNFLKAFSFKGIGNSRQSIRRFVDLK